MTKNIDANIKFASQADVISWIQSFNRFGIKPGLDRVNWLLAELDNPQDKLKIIHIGGTNGKGSTSSLLAGALRANGYRVGLFTSPYLEAFNNRIAIDGSDIDEGALVRVASQVNQAISAMPSEDLGQVTEFEIITVMGLLYFYRQEVDYLILEVGLGGRLDATNVVSPILSIITSIGLDHTDILGHSLAGIASEKAGIIKAGVSVITGAKQAEALTVLEERCQEMGSDIYILGRDFSSRLISANLEGLTIEVSINKNNLLEKTKNIINAVNAVNILNTANDINQQKGKNPFLQSKISDFLEQKWEIGLLGSYQADNLALVIMALAVLSEERGLVMDLELTRQGLRGTRWIGRFELMQEHPRVITDGAHNPQGVEALVKSLADHFGPEESYIWCLGFLGDKDIRQMLDLIIPKAKKIIISKPASGRAATPDYVREIVVETMANKSLDRDELELYFEEDIEQAVKKSIQLAKEEEIVCIAGSLYLIAEARKYWTLEVES